MTAATAVDLAREVADAHGAASLAAADHIAVSFSSGGLAFAAKRQPDALARVEARLSPVRQQIALTGATPRTWMLPDSRGLRRLRIRLPPKIAGHGSDQTVHIGPDGLIRQHDYTATAFGMWARAAQVITSIPALRRRPDRHHPHRDAAPPPPPPRPDPRMDPDPLGATRSSLAAVLVADGGGATRRCRGGAGQSEATRSTVIWSR